EATAVDPQLALRTLLAAGEAAFQAGDQEVPREINRLMAALPASDDSEGALMVRLYLSVNPMTWGEQPNRLREDMARIEGIDDPNLLGSAGGMAFGLGQYALARRLLTRAVERARKLGAAGTLAWILRTLAADELLRGRYIWAEAHASEGRNLAIETGQPNLACFHKALLGE